MLEILTMSSAYDIAGNGSKRHRGVSKMRENLLAAMASPLIPLGEVTALPQALKLVGTHCPAGGGHSAPPGPLARRDSLPPPQEPHNATLSPLGLTVPSIPESFSEILAPMYHEYSRGS